MLPSLDNFICFGKDAFSQRPDYRNMILDIFVTSCTSDHLGEQDAIIGCKLIECLILNLPGHLDEVQIYSSSVRVVLKEFFSR